MGQTCSPRAYEGGDHSPEANGKPQPLASSNVFASRVDVKGLILLLAHSDWRLVDLANGLGLICYFPTAETRRHKVT
jgi:hypothetical protein